LDVAVVTSYGNYASALFNTGDGSFRPELGFGVGIDPGGVVAGDLDGDGQAEIITTDFISNTFTILRKDSRSLYRARRDGLLGAYPDGATSGDFNRDGLLDVAVVSSDRSQVAVVLQDASNSFLAVHRYDAGVRPRAIATADFNDDGVLDLVTASQYDQTIAILEGRSDGSFEAPIHYAAGGEPFDVKVGDLDGDGTPDVVVADHNRTQRGSIVVFINDGNGLFRSPTFYPIGIGPTSVTIADFDSDGRLDIASTNYDDTILSLLINVGSGQFASPQSIGAPRYCWQLTSARMFGSRTDLVVAGPLGTAVFIYRNLGSGRFSPSYVEQVDVGGRALSVGASDLDGDGKTDLAVTGSNAFYIRVFYRDEFGGFEGPFHIQVGWGPSVILADRFAPDGLPDLCVVNTGSETLSLLRPDIDLTRVSIPQDRSSLSTRLNCSPNPFRRDLIVKFSLPRASRGTLAVFDVSGRKIAELARGNLSPGLHQVRWDGASESGSRIGSGIFHVVLTTTDERLVSRAVLLQ